MAPERLAAAFGRRAENGGFIGIWDTRDESWE